MLTRPVPSRPARAPRRRGASLSLAPLSLALLWPAAHGAAFLPGAAADPPTGEIVNPVAQAREPLRSEGIVWKLGPWRRDGTLALDLRGLRLEDGSRARTALLTGDVDLSSYIWQPWFVQLRVGAGFVAARASGDAQGPDSNNAALTGRAAISVFPASRFPFEMRADLSDSRSGNAGVSLGGDYRSRRLSLSQGYRPEVGNDSLQLQLDQSVLSDDHSRDTLTTFSASALRQLGAHQFDLGINHSDNHRSDTDENTRLSSLSARHGYQPSGAMHVETLASWNELRLHASALDASSDVRQIASFATWRLGAPGAAGAPLVAASARWVDARAQGSGGGGRVQAYSGSLGLSEELSPDWRLSVSGQASHLRSASAGAGDSAGVQTAVNWAPASTRAWGGWRYAPSAGANLALSQEAGRDAATDGASRQRRLAGLQASHGVSRDLPMGEGALLALNLSQSGALLHESGGSAVPLARALAHSASVSWLRSDVSGGQSFGGVSFSDSRSAGSAQGVFQLFNAQLSQRVQLTRHSHWAANLTLQAARSQSSEVDVFTGERRDFGQGWQRFYNGSVSFEEQRAFGVPRLRASVLLVVTSQPLERRALGDIDAPRERISESLEARLDHAIGRLETRFSTRVARVEGRVVTALQARAQRRF